MLNINYFRLLFNNNCSWQFDWVDIDPFNLLLHTHWVDRDLLDNCVLQLPLFLLFFLLIDTFEEVLIVNIIFRVIFRGLNDWSFVRHSFKDIYRNPERIRFLHYLDFVVQII